MSLQNSQVSVTLTVAQWSEILGALHSHIEVQPTNVQLDFELSKISTVINEALMRAESNYTYRGNVNINHNG